MIKKKYTNEQQKVKKKLLNKSWAERNIEKVRGYARKYYGLNRDIIVRKAKERRQNNPHESRRFHLKKLYGISIDEYLNMVAKQENLCAICGGKEIANRGLCVDHNHSTGKVRGLLCLNCNAGIGNFRENIDVMLNAIKYLKNND